MKRNNKDKQDCVIPEDFTGHKVIELLEEVGLEIREDEFVSLVSKKLNGNPFALLVAIILSQNTTDKAAIYAYTRLHKLLRGNITPDRMIELGPELIELPIRPAGLSGQKSKWIVEVAKRIKELGGEKILVELPPEELRKILKKMPGIGKKTLDVFLSQMRGEQVFAVDTHAKRIAQRWCLTNSSNYKEISLKLTEFFQGEDLVRAHKLVIALGRKWCTARNPKCRECPLREICPYAVRRLSSTTKRGKNTGQNKK
ncbi:MAG: endonuclease III [Desulfurococcales archaeon]|nr:endonuclease III [Desulfurococcales archaeon]